MDNGYSGDTACNFYRNLQIGDGKQDDIEIEVIGISKDTPVFIHTEEDA